MIYDRNSEHVVQAIKIRDTKIKANLTLTEEEMSIIERGFFLPSTVERIKAKEFELMEALKNIGYFDITINDPAQLDNISGGRFTKDHFIMLLENARQLRNGSLILYTTPNVPNPTYYYLNLNDLEKILVDIDFIINDIKANYRICGVAITGE